MCRRNGYQNFKWLCHNLCKQYFYFLCILCVKTSHTVVEPTAGAFGHGLQIVGEGEKGHFENYSIWGFLK